MKKIFWIALTVLLVACGPAATVVSPAATPNSSPIILDTSSVPSPLPSKTKTTTASLKTPAPTSVPCLQLTRPANGAHLSETGKVEFAWGSQGGAQLYILSLISPEGLREDSRMTTTKFTRSIKASKTGVYYWSVTAYDGKGDLICNPGFIQFTSGAGETDGQVPGGSGGTGEQASDGSGGTGEQASDGSGGTGDQASDGSGGTGDETSSGSDGTGDQAPGFVIVPPAPAITPDGLQIVPEAPAIIPPEKLAPIIVAPIREGIREQIFVERAALSQFGDLPFHLSLLRIPAHINLAQNTGTISVPRVPVEIVSSEPLSADVVPTAPAPTDNASTPTDELIVPPTVEPPATEPETAPPVTEPPVTEPPATAPPDTNPPATEPPATEPPATDLPLVP
jgi:hypothetical protein